MVRTQLAMGMKIVYNHSGSDKSDLSRRFEDISNNGILLALCPSYRSLLFTFTIRIWGANDPVAKDMINGCVSDLLH